MEVVEEERDALKLDVKAQDKVRTPSDCESCACWL
jgi:hypothetical protein